MKSNLDTFGPVLRTITFGKTGKKGWYGNDIFYDAAIIDDNGIKCLHVKVTNIRFTKQNKERVPETFGTYFNVEAYSEYDQDFLARIIGEAISSAIKQSNATTIKELKWRADSLMNMFGGLG